MFFKDVASVCVAADAQRTGAAALALLTEVLLRHTCIHERLPCARPSTWQVFHLQMQIKPDETGAHGQNKHSTVQFYLWRLCGCTLADNPARSAAFIPLLFNQSV